MYFFKQALCIKTVHFVFVATHVDAGGDQMNDLASLLKVISPLVGIPMHYYTVIHMYTNKSH